MLYVSLPWYDLKETQSATDAFWEHLAGRLRSHGLPMFPTGFNETSATRTNGPLAGFCSAKPAATTCCCRSEAIFA